MTTSALLWRWLTLRPNWFSFPQMHLLSWNKILLLYNYCKPMEKFKYIFTFKDILSNLKNIDILLNMKRTEIMFLTRFSQTNSFRCNSCNINLFPCILLSLISLSYPCILLSFHNVTFHYWHLALNIQTCIILIIVLRRFCLNIHIYFMIYMMVAYYRVTGWFCFSAKNPNW